MAKNTYNQSPSRDKKIDTIGLDMGKVPPQALDIEEAVLGAMLLEPSVVPDVMESLMTECFYKETNKRIFDAIKSLFTSHNSIDIFTVAEELKKTNSLEEIGGPFYLSQLTSKIGAAAHIEYHTKILLQKYIQRELITISNNVQRDSFDDSIPVDVLLEDAQEKLFSLSEKNMKRETQPIQDVIKNTIAEMESYKEREDGLSGVPSGYTGIDKITLGWQKSDLIIVAARPAMGKTAFVLTMARNMAVDHHIPVAFFSLEMSSLQLARRLLVSETGLSSEKIRGGKKMADHEWVQLNERINDLTKSPLYIDDTPSLSITEFRAKARKLRRTAKVEMIVIDYLQLMTGPPGMQGMREQEVAAISRSLKAVAKELEIPIIALSQLSRAVETRGGNRRPQLSDLRESGAIEQDADIVLFIHRPEYYGLQEDTTTQGLAEIIIAKHRNGSTGDIRMRFRANEAKFYDDDEVNYSDSLYDVDHQETESRMNASTDFDPSSF